MSEPLLDFHFLRMGTDLIRPFNPEQVNPASYNLTIGRNLIREAPDGELTESVTGTRERPTMINPGEWLLVDVSEEVEIPSDHEAQVILRSSAARAGWDHALAGYVDPGYQGRLTLEFVNCRRFQSLPIYQGLQLVQLRVCQLGRSPLRPYGLTGRYHKARQVEACKDARLEPAPIERAPGAPPRLWVAAQQPARPAPRR